MRYPIDAEKYIAAMRLEFGPDAAAEEAHRLIIPLVNDAYNDGLRGVSGYPLVLDTERQALAEHLGKSPEHIQENKLLPPLIEWVNRAYIQGRQDAKEVPA